MSDTLTPTLHLDDLPVGSTRMIHVDGRRLCLAHTAAGIFAVDHACPHMGYGISQGSLDGNLVTCAWHNWKFDVRTGECVQGDEDLGTHEVDVSEDGAIAVRVRRHDPAAGRAERLESLRTGIARDRVGQMSREVVRLLQLGMTPAELVAEGVAYGCPRTEYGWDHEIANAADCLAMAMDSATGPALFEGSGRALPVVQALAGIAEAVRDRPVVPLAQPLAVLPADASARFAAAVEAERTADAQALLGAALSDGAVADDVMPWFAEVVSAHLLGYGHGAIYVQKGFQLLAMIGWEHAPEVLGHLVTGLVSSTRMDVLPYVRPFVRTLDTGGVAPSEPLIDVLLGPDRRAAIGPAVRAQRDAGATAGSVLDTVVETAARRMLRYDVAGERDLLDDFGWLDITHVITYANAARWLVDQVPGWDPWRLVAFTAFLAHWSGRHEWHTAVGTEAPVDLPAGSLADVGAEMQRAALTDGAGSFIVAAHAVKLSRAATEEAVRTRSPLALQATWRLMHSDRMERFVAETVAQSIEFLSGRAPRDT